MHKFDILILNIAFQEALLILDIMSVVLLGDLMMFNSSNKYQKLKPMVLTNRKWPNQSIVTAPRWLSTDLRDGNQALIDPMNVDTKIIFFELLLKMGFKEIEVGYPTASAIEFDFIRRLIEEDKIPNDVTIQVITPAREELIEQTFLSLKGAHRAILHLYIAISPVWQKVVFNSNSEKIKQITLQSIALIKKLMREGPSTQWSFQFTPETFSATEPLISLDICNAVIDLWQPSDPNHLLINLPATVEVSSPNVFADQVEWMSRHLHARDKITLSIHPHNDRGTAVAAAELALMAGAQRVEGCLFANGERTGNVDLVTLALNLHSQGIDPRLDFSNIDYIRHIVEECTQMPIHPRHPYAGALVFTAFSGSHQDAIKKGLSRQPQEGAWEVPYLPIDPSDLGRRYDNIIRINSQSGKGGVGYILKQKYGLNVPRNMLIEFNRSIKNQVNENTKEISHENIYELFCKEYIVTQPWTYLCHSYLQNTKREISITTEVMHNNKAYQLIGLGNGPLDAFINSLHMYEIYILDYKQHSIESGSQAKAVSYIEMKINKKHIIYGLGIDPNLVSSGIKAILCGLNRSLRE